MEPLKVEQKIGFLENHPQATIIAIRFTHDLATERKSNQQTLRNQNQNKLFGFIPRKV